MTRDELEGSLEEIETQREILLSVLNELEKSESESTKLQEEPDLKAKENSTGKNFKKILYDAIASGSLQKALIRLADGMDLTKVALKSLSDIIDKTKNKLEGKVEEVAGPTGMPIMTDMWLPMLLSLLQTQEFQHLMANMFAQLVKDG